MTVFPLLTFLFACYASNPDNLAFKTTIIENAHLTLAVIPFKIRASNFLIFLPLQTYEKQFAEFLLLSVYNSLVKYMTAWVVTF